jgi:folate/biopterin transporter
MHAPLGRDEVPQAFLLAPKVPTEPLDSLSRATSRTHLRAGHRVLAHLAPRQSSALEHDQLVLTWCGQSTRPMLWRRWRPAPSRWSMHRRQPTAGPHRTKRVTTRERPWDTARLRTFLRDRVLQGHEPTPELAAILLVYLVQGVVGLSRLATVFFLKDELQLSPSQLAMISGIQILPWTIKPLYGFLSDAVPLFGYHRRSYLSLAGAIGALSWLGLALWAHTPLQALVCTTAASLAVAVSDVVADGIVVERVRGSPQERAGSLQSLCWGTSALGSLVTAYFSGSLLERFAPRQIFAITAVFPLMISATSFFIEERRFSDDGLPIDVTLADHQTVQGTERPLRANKTNRYGQQVSRDARELLGKLWVAIRQPSILYPTAFVFLWQSTPSAETAFFYYMTNALQFQPEFLGRIRVVSSAAMLLGVVVYNRFLKKIPIKSVLRWSTVLSVPLGMSQLILVTGWNVRWGIPNTWFVLGDAAVLTALGQVAFMPTLVLAARLCPPGAESVVFATLMSLYNASGFVGTELGALLTQAFGITDHDFRNLWALIVICNLSSLLPLVFIDFLDRAPTANDEELPSSVTTSVVADDLDSLDGLERGRFPPAGSRQKVDPPARP